MSSRESEPHVLTTDRPRSPSPPHPFSTAEYPIIDPAQLVDEETVAWYDPEDFYPVRIGEVFQSRYQVVSKLGYGGYSTVWLCRDLLEHRHVTVKVCSQNSIPIKRELAAYEHLNNLPKTQHPGRKSIRTLLDHFELTYDHDASSRSFQCLVFEPLAETIWSLRQQVPGKQLPEAWFKPIVGHVLNALAYLHDEAKIVHTDVQENNILLSIIGPGSCQAHEEKERAEPSPRKVVGDRIIYLSNPIEPSEDYGPPVLCDFGEARIGKATYTGLIQPQVYRAPEVILRMPWNEKVDIWSVGTMIWDMFEGKHLFDTGPDADDDTDNRYHIAHMVSLLGPPPVEFLKRSATEEPRKYFDSEGNWTGTIDLPEDSFELSEQRLEAFAGSLHSSRRTSRLLNRRCVFHFLLCWDGSSTHRVFHTFLSSPTPL